MLKIIICSSLGNKQLQKCLSSLLSTINKEDFDIEIIREREFREITLNEALKNNRKRDLLIVGDDIVFTDGWYKAFLRNKKYGDIIGFSMLYPGTDKIQDNGYNLIKIDDRITLSPKNRGKKIKEIKNFEYKSCDTICGCAMYIKKKVLSKIKAFSKNGQNRWGEFIYTQQAKKAGYKIIVLGHYLYHEGKSTKVNKNIKYSSISWQREKKGWKKVVEKYIDEAKIKMIYKSELLKGFRNIVNKNQHILVYGIGTIAELIVRSADLKNIDFCTGLKEEVGIRFFKKQVMFYKSVEYKNYDYIIISPLDISDEIYKNKLTKYLSEKNIVYKTNCSMRKRIFNYRLVKV